MRDMSDANMVIEFAGKSDVVIKLGDGKIISTKTVALVDLLMALSRDMEITTGILPHGTRFYRGTKQEYSIGIQVQGKVRTAEFRLPEVGSTTMTVPFPELLFIFSISDKRVTETKLFSCIPPIGRPHDRLYMFPYGNVYDKTGRVCWGSIVLPEIAEPVMLDGVVARFFTSVFSGHLISGTSTFHPPEGVVNLRTLLGHMVGKEYFPDKVLKASELTIGAAMTAKDG